TPAPSTRRCRRSCPARTRPSASRRSPTAAPPPGGPPGDRPCHAWRSWSRLLAGRDLLGGEIAVGAVRDHALAGLQPQPGAVEFCHDLVRLKGQETGNAPDLGPGILVRPHGAPRVVNVVVTAQAFVRAERLAGGRGERGFVDVGARDVPAGREPG